MQVFYTARQRNPRLPVVYRAGRVRFCCPEMERRWGALVAFGVPGKATTAREVCLSVPRPQANGTPILEVVAIDFCPFCGRAVEVCRVK